MKSFWSRGRSYDLEARLRADKPEPSSEFVTSLAERVRTEPRPARGGVRVAFAGALTVVLLGALAPVGALGSAGGAAKGLVSAAAHAVGTHAQPTAGNSPAHNQYVRKHKCPTGTKKKGKRCIKVKKKAKGARVARRGPRFTG